MGLETGEFIADLDRTNPVTATDPVTEGSDHLRLVKKVIQQTFPDFDAAVTLTLAELNALVDAALKSQSATISANWTFSALLLLSGSIRLRNNTDIVGEDSGGTPQNLIKVQSDDRIALYDIDYLRATHNIGVEGYFWNVSGASAATLSSGDSGGLQVDTIAGGLSRVPTLDDPATWESQQNHNATIVLANNVSLRGRKVDLNDFPIVLVDAGDRATFGHQSLEGTLKALTEYSLQIGGSEIGKLVSAALGGLLIEDIAGTPRKVGFRGPPWVARGGSFAPIQQDEGTIQHGSSGGIVTCTLNTLEQFTTFRFLQQSASGGTIVKGTITTLYLQVPGAISQAVTSITVAPGATAEISYSATGIVYVFGAGLTGVP